MCQGEDADETEHRLPVRGHLYRSLNTQTNPPVTVVEVERDWTEERHGATGNFGVMDVVSILVWVVLSWV